MSMKNMALMFGAMALMRRIDQEEPLVLMYTRIFYTAYLVITALVYLFLHYRITTQRDTTKIEVPIPPKAPSMSEALVAARSQDDETTPSSKPSSASKSSPDENDSQKPPEEEIITVMEYDLRQLANARKGWITNACLLAAINYKMESVSPLIMSALMGFSRLLADDPLFQIHVRRAPAVGNLKRPFAAPKNPLADMLKEMTPKAEETSDSATTAPAEGGGQQVAAQPAEDLHDDGDDDLDDDTPPPAIDDLKDDHIKSDFDDDDEEHNLAQESKKTQ